MSDEKKTEGRQKWTREQIMLLVVVLATVWAAAYATAASNKSTDASTASTAAVNRVDEGVSQIKDMSICNREVLGDALQVLNARTANSVPQAQANIALQRAQLRFTTTILKPEVQENDTSKALQDYVRAQNKFLELATSTKKATEDTAYPDDDAIDQCLADRERARTDKAAD